MYTIGLLIKKLDAFKTIVRFDLIQNSIFQLRSLQMLHGKYQ